MRLKTELDRLYADYHHRRFVHPDPVEFVYAYPDPADRELVGLVAASLAYGRVARILSSVESVLGVLGASPRRRLMRMNRRELEQSLEGFVHRFATGMHVSALLWAVRRIIETSGSLNACFVDGMEPSAPTVHPACCSFVRRIRDAGGTASGHLLPDPAKGSACKRLHLYLRWMARCDEIDPGGWSNVPPSALLVPLDVHMHRAAAAMGMTRRKSSDLKTVLEVTDGFRTLAPEDPVRYDFVVTRLGIRSDLSMPAFIRRFHENPG
ncbi:MAG: TIGR02757 family protein [Desulfobacterales bacterium]